METTATPLPIEVGARIGSVSALLLEAPDEWALMALAHGAGAGMRHRFMEEVAVALAGQGISTLRYQFPYMEQGGRRPDPPAVLEATVRAAVRHAASCAGDRVLLAGGKSLGGRMTSNATARESLGGVAGLVFFGFPLHPAKQPGTSRADHLERVAAPMLFLQGTRDPLADLTLITEVCRRLGARATLHVVEGADHGFDVLKRSGRTGAEVLDELARTVSGWGRARTG